jgi:hypothetical protein
MSGASTPPSDPAGYGSGGVSQPGDLPRIEHRRSDPPARLANLCCGHATCQHQVQRAIADALCEFSEYLAAKAAIAVTTVGEAYAEGLTMASVDAELFVGSIRGRWRETGE